MIRCWSPWTLPAVVLEYDTMAIRAPAAIAARYGGRNVASRVASSIGSTPWSIRYGPVGPIAVELP